MSTDIKAIQELVDSTRSKMRVTKVVATRAVKTRKGDFFCGMSSAWDSRQDDVSGQGSDAGISPMGDSEIAQSGMTVEEARVAHVLLALEASLGACRAAVTDGAITMSDFNYRVSNAKKNTLAHLSRLMPQGEAKDKVEDVSSAA